MGAVGGRKGSQGSNEGGNKGGSERVVNPRGQGEGNIPGHQFASGWQ